MRGISHAPRWRSALDVRWDRTQPHPTPPLTVLASGTPPTPAGARKPSHKRAWVMVTVAILLVLGFIGLATRSVNKAAKVTPGPSSAAPTAPTTPAPTTPSSARAMPSPTTPGTLTPAQLGNAALDAAAQRVQAVAVEAVVTLQTANARSDGITQLAAVAQDAYDKLNSIKSTDADAFSNSGDAGYEMYGAVNDLKNSMGALSAYASDPSPTALAQFNTQWQAAVSKWNDGVSKVYARSVLTAPTIPTS